MLRNVATLTMAFSLLALIVLYDGSRIWTWLPSISLAIVGYVTWRLARFNPLAFSAILLLALWLILTGSVVLYPSVPLTPVYCLLILTAAFLLSPIASTLLAAASVGAMIGLGRLLPGLESADILAMSLFIATVTAILAWLFAAPLTSALGWAWIAYERAETKTSEARARQVELGRVSKSLNETLTTLEDLNRQLAEARAMAEEARRLKAEF